MLCYKEGLLTVGAEVTSCNSEACHSKFDFFSFILEGRGDGFSADPHNTSSNSGFVSLLIGFPHHFLFVLIAIWGESDINI